MEIETEKDLSGGEKICSCELADCVACQVCRPKQRDQTGATAVDYALLVVLVAGVIVFALSLFGEAIRPMFDAVNSVWPSIP